MRNTVAAAAMILLVAGCSKADQTATDSAAATPAVTAAGGAAVHILSPANGDTVSQPFTLKLSADGVEVIAANGTSEPGKGHHHLIIDGDVGSDTLPLMPAPVVIHMGNGASERVMDSLSPGPHRIVAVFADGKHVPMLNVKRDTITVIIR